MFTTVNSPGDPKSLEVWEVKEGEIRGEESEKEASLIEEFRRNPEAQALKNGLPEISSLENPNAVFERVVSLYAKNGENLKKALSDTFSPPHSTQIGLPEFSEAERGKIVQGLISYTDLPQEGENIGKDKDGGDMAGKGKGATVEVSQNDSLPGDTSPGKNGEALQNTKIEENPGYPTLKRFAADGKITPEEFEAITTAMTPKGGNEELLGLIKTHIGDSGVQAELGAFFEEQDPELAKENFFKDAKVPEGDGKGKQEDTITELIGENYRQIPDTNGKTNIKADTKLAIQTACNKTIAGKHIKRDETVRDALSTIQAGESIPLMVASLRVLHEKVNTGEGMKDGGEAEDEGDIGKAGEGGQDDISGVLGEVNQIIAEARAKHDSVRVAKAKELKTVLASEESVEGGEAGMGGGELDTLLQEISLPTKSA